MIKHFILEIQFLVSNINYNLRIYSFCLEFLKNCGKYRKCFAWYSKFTKNVYKYLAADFWWIFQQKMDQIDYIIYSRYYLTKKTRQIRNIFEQCMILSSWNHLRLNILGKIKIIFNWSETLLIWCNEFTRSKLCLKNLILYNISCLQTIEKQTRSKSNFRFLQKDF